MCAVADPAAGWGGGGEGGSKKKASMWPLLKAIFFMTYFYRTGGEGERHGQLVPSTWICYWCVCVCTVWQCNQNRKKIKYPRDTKHGAQKITSTYIFISFYTYSCIASFIFLYLMLQFTPRFTQNSAHCKLQANFTLFITSLIIIIQAVFVSNIFMFPWNVV